MRQPAARIDFANADYYSITTQLIATNWDSVFDGASDVESVFSKLMEYLNTLIKMNVPPKHLRRRQPIDAVTAKLMKLISLCPLDDEIKMKLLRAELTRCVTRRRCVLERRIVESSDPARFFGYASARLKMKDDLSVLVSTKVVRVTNDREKADLLCDFFEEIYNDVKPEPQARLECSIPVISL